MTAVAYNLLMAAVDLAGLWLIGRRRTVVRCCGVFLLQAMAGMMIALLIEHHFFAFICLLTWGLFLHGPVMLTGSAVLLWPARRCWAIGLAAGVVALAAVAGDAFLLEPTWLEVSHYQIASSRLTRPLRIVVIADVHVDRLGQYEREVFRRAIEEKPDMVLLAGDYLQPGPGAADEARAQFHELLVQFRRQTTAPIFAVPGNADSPAWQELFQGCGVATVDRSQTYACLGLHVTCLDFESSSDRNLRASRPAGDGFHLVLGHVPNFALGQVDADLLVAGHTHGGQVRLPLLGPLVTLSAVPRRWAAGMTQLPRGGVLVVSRGIGMERGAAPPVRFLCRPELVVIDLAPSPQ
jgi:hypothetical protein